MRTLIFVLITAVLLFGCSSADMKAYIAADQQTYDAITPEYLEMIESSDKLDKDQKERRKRLIETWKLRIDAGLKALE